MLDGDLEGRPARLCVELRQRRSLELSDQCRRHDRLLQSIAATTSAGFGPRDEDFSDDGAYLYAIDIASHHVHAFIQNGDETLTPAGAFGNLPLTVAGIAAY